ncbi:MAG TPA: hypothetical protein VN622_11100 [Clostridia bacterium]|nr:hypothetical protein [Clostridia bacterium]
MSATTIAEMPSQERAKKSLVLREPSADAKYLLRQAASTLQKEGFDYREGTDLFRVYYMDVALLMDGGVKKAAAKRIGISRNHVRDFYKRAVDVLR